MKKKYVSREQLEFFIDKLVKLERQNGFHLLGKITQVSDEFILFKSEQTESMINVSDIKSIVVKQGVSQ